MDDRPVHVDLFSGVGGFSLAAQWAGFDTRLHCEIDPYCRRVLAKHWPEVPIHGNVYTLTGDIVRGHLAFDYTASDLSDATGARCTEGSCGADEAPQWRREPEPERPDTHVDLLTGGFPCQPFSVAGKRRGAADDRHLWPQMLRLIQEIRPAWVCGENVNGIVSMALDGVAADLEAAGYAVQAVVLPACGVGAWHKRERAFILAHDLSDAACIGRQRVGATCAGRDGLTDGRHPWLGWDGRRPLDALWQSEPAVCRVDDGLSAGLVYRGRLTGRMPHRAKRLRALGNAVPPPLVYPILAAIRARIGRGEGG